MNDLNTWLVSVAAVCSAFALALSLMNFKLHVINNEKWDALERGEK